MSTATITATPATATAVDDEIRIEVDAHNLSSAQYTALVTALARAGVGQPTSDAVIRKEIGSGVGWAFALRVRLDTTTIAQPAPATDTMIVGTGDAKAIPPGLAEELAGMAPENRAVDRAKREGVL